MLAIGQVMEKSTEVNSEDCGENGYLNAKSRGLSAKDAGIILIMSTLLSISVVTACLGLNGVSQRVNQSSGIELTFTVGFVILLFSAIFYVLVKTAAHYLVYLAVGTFFALVFPVSRKRQRSAIEEVYSKAEKRR